MTKEYFNCPHCKAQLAITPTQIIDRSALTPWNPLDQFMNVSQGPLPGQGQPLAGEWQKVTPVGRLVPKDIATVLLDSTIVFGLVSGCLGLLLYQIDKPWLIGPFTGLFVAGVRYLVLMANTQNLLTIVESWRSAEQPKKPDPGRVPSPVVTVQIKEGKRFKYAYFGLDESKLYSFAEALLDGAKFTEDQARKHGINQEELKAFREELINRGLAYWNNPSQPRMGVTLRHSAYTVLQGIIDSKQQQAAEERG